MTYQLALRMEKFYMDFQIFCGSIMKHEVQGVYAEKSYTP